MNLKKLSLIRNYDKGDLIMEEEMKQNETMDTAASGDGETSSSSEKKKKEKVKQKPIEAFYDCFEVVCFAAAVVLLLFMFVGRMSTVVGSSMANTLQNGDRILVWDLFYKPDRYDIVVVQKEEGYYADELLVKRVIAKGGDTVTFDFDDWKVFVNGEEMDNSFVLIEAGEDMERGFVPYSNTVVVPEGYYYVLGDNRNGSTDSRFPEVGFVKESEIIGKVIFRIMPLNHMKVLDYQE